MARQYQIPGGPYVNEATGAQFAMPGYGFLNASQGAPEGMAGAATADAAGTGTLTTQIPLAGSAVAQAAADAELNKGALSGSAAGAASAAAALDTAIPLEGDAAARASGPASLTTVPVPIPPGVTRGAWLEIDTDPPRAFFQQGDPPAGFDLAYRRLVGVGAIRRPLSIPGLVSAETANLTATLDNADGALTALFGASPPLRIPARVVHDGTVLIAGTITGLDLGESASIAIEAGAARPLSDPLPLRNTTVWGGYKDVRTIPQGYGSITVTPIPYDQEGRLFVLLDHPAAGVDRVTRDDAATDAWAFSNQIDSTGHPVSFLELAEPLAEGESLVVTLRGKRHPITGALLDTPALILWDILNHVAGIPVAWADLDDFRTQTQGIVLGGLLDDATATARAVIDTLMQSAGAAWSAGMPGIATLWPPEPDDAAPATVANRLTASDIRPSTDHSGLVTVLRVLYDYDHAAGKHRRALQVEAPEAIQRFGRIESEWNAGWLRSPRLAETLARRMLRLLARPRWRITWSQRYAVLPTGAWIDLDHPHSPIAGRHRLVSGEIDPAGPSLTCTIEAPVGVVPAIETTALATAFEPLVQSGAAVEYRDGVATFTIRDEQGQPLAGAKATIDGTTTRFTDNGGRVSFPVARGAHVLYAEATGYAPMEIEVTV